jgi:hypothetical protein
VIATRSGAACVAAVAVLVTVSGCGGGSTPKPPHSGPTAPSASPSVAASKQIATGCTPSDLPKGYTVDAKHSGKLTAHNYSASADVQAALEFDQLQAGGRDVFLHSTGKKIDGVASCVAMQFPTAHLAGRFFLSYRALRKDAGSLVTKIAIPGGASGLSGATGYLEKDQSFRGYKIASTDVIEFSGRDGAQLDIVSVAGAQPSRTLGHQLLAAMAAK